MNNLKPEKYITYAICFQGKIKFPPKSFIVDLMHEPGCLLPADAPNAEQYKRL